VGVPFGVIILSTRESQLIQVLLNLNTTRYVNPSLTSVHVGDKIKLMKWIQINEAIVAVAVIADWEAVVKLSDDFNGADLRNVCTEAGRS